MDIAEVECLGGEWIQEISDGVDLTGEWGCLEDEGQAWDDVHGRVLPTSLVREARLEEVGFMVEKGIWEERPIEECWKRTGKPPTSVRRVDMNRGSLTELIIRSRLVARDFKGVIEIGMICSRRRPL